VKKSRRGSQPEEMSTAPVEGRRASAPQIAPSPVAEFNEDMFDFGEESKTNVFDNMEEDLRMIHHPQNDQEAVPVKAAPAAVIYTMMPKVYVQPQPQQPQLPMIDMLFAPKPSTYYRNSDAKPAAKSLEELLKAGKKEDPVHITKTSEFVFVDEFLSQFEGMDDVRRKKQENSVVAPQVAEKEPEVKMMEDDLSDLIAIPAAPVAVRPVAPMMDILAIPPAPPVAAAQPEVSLTKAQAMAKKFDQARSNADERRSSMPKEHDGDMFILTGMRPVKPVHTGMDN